MVIRLVEVEMCFYLVVWHHAAIRFKGHVTWQLGHPHHATECCDCRSFGSGDRATLNYEMTLAHVIKGLKTCSKFDAFRAVCKRR